MRIAAIISLILLLSYPLLLKIGIIGYWQFNRDYIARTLCDFKDIKDSPCKGKCYLMKKIKGTEVPAKEDFNFPLSFLKITDKESIIPMKLAGFCFMCTEILQSDLPEYIFNYTLTSIISIFQPPE